MGYYSELDIIMRDKIREYEAENGEYDYYGFKDNGLGDAKKVEIYGITQEDLDRELEKYEREIDEGGGEYYTLDEVDEMLKKRINKSNDLRLNIKENDDER